MYQVTLINNGINTIINSVSTENRAPRIEGSFKQGINCIDTFNFNIMPNNPGFEAIKPLKTLVEILNTKTNEIEFKGRVLMPLPSMDSSGVFKKSLICESELAYLMDTCTRFGEYHDITVRNFLNILIDNHNRQSSPDKHFQIGIVNVEANLYRFLSYQQTTFESIKDNLLDRLGGEIRVRYENGIRYLDYLKEIGQVEEVEIRLAKNLISIEKEVDPTQVITRLVAYGAKKEDSEERIDFKNLNNGKDYLDDEEAIKEFGIIEKTILWDDVTVPENLLKKAQEKQKEVNKLLVKHKIEALDLSTIGLDIATFKVYNKYKVINPIMGIEEYLRVIEKTTDINNPQNASLMIGDKFEDIKNTQLKIRATERNLEKVNSTVNTTISLVTNVSSNLNETVEVLNTTVESLNATNKDVSTINSNLIKVNISLENNIEETKMLKDTTTTIIEKLAGTNNKLDKLRKRVMLGVY